MATRSRIGIQNKDGSITSIYSHWDGYPSHHGPILRDAYSEEESVRALLALGDVSILGRSLGEAHDFDSHDTESDTCLAYGRDRSEEGTEAETHAADAWPDSGDEYRYLFTPGGWTASEYGAVFVPLEIAMEADA